MKQLLFIPLFLFVCLSSCSTQGSKAIMKEIEEQNRLMPMMVFDNIRADSTAYHEDTQTITYYYTLLNEADSPFSEMELADTKERLLSVVREAKGLQAHRQQRITMCYVYCSAQTTQELARILITPDMYK